MSIPVTVSSTQDYEEYRKDHKQKTHYFCRKCGVEVEKNAFSTILGKECDNCQPSYEEFTEMLVTL